VILKNIGKFLQAPLQGAQQSEQNILLVLGENKANEAAAHVKDVVCSYSTKMSARKLL
jgi:hypothetical protein